MKTVCEKNMCAGCMACVNICHKNAIKIKDSLSAYNAVIDENECINCNACHNVCPKNNTPSLRKPMEWYQGWASDEEIRKTSSSGGFATAISLGFINRRGVVYGCEFAEGEFSFARATREEELEMIKGSKYVKSNPKEVFDSIKGDLSLGMPVLFIGLPCQVAALNNYIDDSLLNNLYTVDLICHGTPSPQLLNIFLKKYNKSLKSMRDIAFRQKNKMQVWGDNEGIVTKGVSDKYTISFVNGLTYTDNCYKCDFARIERVSDITLGDSWGSELESEIKKGISLALCQTEKGKQLLLNANVELKDVDLDEAVKNNKQLKQPSIMLESRKSFFESIINGKSFNREVFKRFPKECVKQDVKSFLIKLKLIKGN